MSDNLDGTGDSVGQVDLDPVTGKPEPIPIVDDGEPTIVDEDTSVAAGEGEVTPAPKSDDILYDPLEYERITKDLDPDVKTQIDAFQKSLQGDYTKKTQNVAEVRKNAEAYQAFIEDPHGTLEKVATQLGYELKGRGGTGNQPTPAPPLEDFNPQTWGEVLETLKTSVMQDLKGEVQGQLAPMLGEVNTIRRSSFESALTKIDPSWKEYEGAIVSNLKTYPQLLKEPGKLYKISVPDSVLEGKATQKVLQKLKEKGKSTKVAGISTITKKPGVEASSGISSFEEAFAFAKQSAAEKGLKPS